MSFFHRPFPQGVQILLQKFHIFLFLIILQILQLSANSLTLDSMFLQITFTFTTNNSVPKTLRCVTSEFNLTSLNSFPPTLTLSVPPTSNSFAQTTILEYTPRTDSFVSSLS